MSEHLVPHDTTPPPAVRMLGITKRFGAVTACSEVDFVLGHGEVHCLLGENGAGKTTLMSILFGLIPPDDGQIVIDGRSVQLSSPRDALRHGIGMVHQHFMLVPEFTVAENVVLGSRSAWTPRFDRVRAEEEVRAVAESSGLQVDPRALVRDIPVDVQQRVEILKLLHRGAKVLILDEPTASLGPAGIRSLFDGLETLRARGHSAILITHKLTEVTAVADGVTVLRGGRLRGSFRRGHYAEAELARAMTGGDIAALPVRRARVEGGVTLRVAGLTVNDTVLGRPAVEDLSFEVAAGEILGIAGVEGNGQRELADAIAGVVPVAAGSVALGDLDVTALPPRDRHAAGMGVIPEDRLKWGLVADLTLAENLALSDISRGGLRGRGRLLDLPGMRSRAAELLEQYQVRPPDPAARASQLSGGNQQKVVVAREMSREPRLLVAAQPTRGLDVGAIDYVHRRILEMRDRGGAVLLVTNELEELLALSDRVAVMYRGRFAYRSDAADADVDAIAMAMAGVTHDGAGTAQAETAQEVA